MVRFFKILFAGILFIAAGAGNLCAVDDLNGSFGDYQRMNAMRNSTRGKVRGERIVPTWLNPESFVYRAPIAPGHDEFRRVDVVQGKQRPAFDHRELAKQLTEQSGQKVDWKQLPFQTLFQLDGSSGDRLAFRALGSAWEWDEARKQLTKKPDGFSVSTPSDYRIRRSEQLGGACNVSFYNHRDEPIRIFWIDHRLRRRFYSDLASGKTYESGTTVGHVWLITDSAGKTLTVVQAMADQVFEIGKDLKPQREDVGSNRRSRRGGGRSPKSPDGRWTVAAESSNLWLVEAGSKEDQRHRLTEDGTEGHAYEGPFQWSADSKYLLAFRRKAGDRRQVHLLRLEPGDVTSRHRVLNYPKPGDNIDVRSPVLFRLPEKQRVSIDDSLFQQPWSLRDFEWREDSQAFSFVFNQRGHQALRVVEVDAGSGSTRALIDEQSKTFIDYAGKYFFRRLPESRELIWMSERSGWNHLYLYDAETGQLKNPITRGNWVVRGVDRVDTVNRRVYFRASGLSADQDPYQIHYCHVGLDGEGFVQMTHSDGNHSIQFSPDDRFLIDTWSRLDQPPVHELRESATGRLVCQLHEANIDELKATGWSMPVPFRAKGRDGETDIYGVIYFPQRMDPEKKYPVVEYIYAGPQDSFVPKSFLVNRREKELAELGFIVVQIDGMGTSNRSKKFHDVCWKNLGDSGFPDRIAWMKAAQEKFPQMDLERVGIYGGSAGGQSALRALLAHGDFYDAAVADCGCHDNQMDKIWWNELWMGWPVGDHYRQQSNVTQAGKLKGKLFLIVGADDRNVDPASTMQVVNELIRADKDFDLLVVPNGGHGIGSGRYGMRRTRDFFVRHLIGREPRHSPPTATK